MSRIASLAGLIGERSIYRGAQYCLIFMIGAENDSKFDLEVSVFNLDARLEILLFGSGKLKIQVLYE
jgi:hypothetical protein